MVILTIQFAKGNKTYDYLMYNPKKLKIDRSKPLNLLIGSSMSSEVHLVNAVKVDNLPKHVSKGLEIYENNCIVVTNIHGIKSSISTLDISKVSTTKKTRSTFIQAFNKWWTERYGEKGK